MSAEIRSVATEIVVDVGQNHGRLVDRGAGRGRREVAGRKDCRDLFVRHDLRRTGQQLRGLSGFNLMFP